MTELEEGLKHQLKLRELRLAKVTEALASLSIQFEAMRAVNDQVLQLLEVKGQTVRSPALRTLAKAARRRQP